MFSLKKVQSSKAFQQRFFLLFEPSLSSKRNILNVVFVKFMKKKKHNNWLIIHPINNTQKISVGHITNVPIKKIIGK